MTAFAYCVRSALVVAIGGVIGCSGTTVGGSSNALKDAGTKSDGGGGSSSGSGGSSGARDTGGVPNAGANGSGGIVAGGGGTAGASGSAGAGTMFCGVETCGPDTKCCPLSGTCYGPNGASCVGMGCASANGAPPDPKCCGNGLVFCPTTSSCYHAGCENCCPPDVTCNQQADCPSGFSCCYSSRRCYNPLIDECSNTPPKCDASGACPGNMVCCAQHGICYEPGCTDCCPSTCAPTTAHCSAQMPCCNGGTCCSGVPVPQGQEYCSQNGNCPISDRNAKHDIVPVDTDRVLASVAAMSITEWSYNDDATAARHIGPMAQDFHAAFETGSSDKCIPTVDENGVALAAIQALYRRVERIDEETRALREENTRLRVELERLHRGAK